MIIAIWLIDCLIDCLIDWLIIDTVHKKGTMACKNKISAISFYWEYKGNVGFCPQVLYVSSAVSPRFSLVLDPSGQLGGKDGSACEEFEDSEAGILG